MNDEMRALEESLKKYDEDELIQKLEQFILKHKRDLAFWSRAFNRLGWIDKASPEVAAEVVE